ncbi:hypothetical protein [Sphingomonas changnyeongensis]|uniref:hypothetical protein n=1 Tax=Sphingomonas changnyeongensis TaxID=2698679 RepID=UPI001E43F1F8|nr:hypothetical protein [Sphingomonas changnyeongensis]
MRQISTAARQSPVAAQIMPRFQNGRAERATRRSIPAPGKSVDCIACSVIMPDSIAGIGLKD